MTHEYSQGRSGKGAVIAIIVIVVIIILLVLFFYVFSKNKREVVKRPKRRIRKPRYPPPRQSTNPPQPTPSPQPPTSNRISPQCDVISVCRDALERGEKGARKILNESISFIETCNSGDLSGLSQFTNEFGGYVTVIKPGTTIENSVIVYDINPEYVNIPVGNLNPEVKDAVRSILMGIQQDLEIVCYNWQGHTKFTVINRTNDGKYVVASGYRLHPIQ